LKALHFHVEITKFVAHLKQGVSLEALMELKKNILWRNILMHTSTQCSFWTIGKKNYMQKKHIVMSTWNISGQSKMQH